MSADDKKKLDDIAAGAEVNQNAFSNVKVGEVTVAADAKTDTFEVTGATGITVSADAATKKITITGTTYKVFAGATTTSAGTAGLVKAPAAGDQAKFLMGNGTWSAKPVVEEDELILNCVAG